jgi:hypothetical protein
VLNQDSKFWIPQTACEGEHDLVQICNMPSSEEINSQDSVLSQASVTAIQQRFHNLLSCQRRITSGNQTTEDRYGRRMLLRCEHIPILKLQQRIQLNVNMWMLSTVLFFSRGRLPQGYPFEAFTNNNCSRLRTKLCVYGDEETWQDICTPVSKSEDIDLKCLLPCTSTDFKLGVKISGRNLLP